MQRTHARAVAFLLVVLTLATAAGCRGDDPDPAVRATVTRWVDAWTRASGYDRDDVAAAQARAELGGALLTRTEAAARDAVGAPRARLLSRMYNDFVGLAIPPDRGFTLLAVERHGDNARVTVRLHYSHAAPGAAAAAGLVSFNQVAGLSALAAHSPEPVFTVVRVDGAWRITAIRTR